MCEMYKSNDVKAKQALEFGLTLKPLLDPVASVDCDIQHNLDLVLRWQTRNRDDIKSDEAEVRARANERYQRSLFCRVEVLSKEKHHDKSEMAQLQLVLGEAIMEGDEYSKAASMLIKGLDASKALKIPAPLWVRYEHILAHLLSRLGRWKECMSRYASVLEEYRRLAVDSADSESLFSVPGHLFGAMADVQARVGMQMLSFGMFEEALAKFEYALVNIRRYIEYAQQRNQRLLEQPDILTWPIEMEDDVADETSAGRMLAAVAQMRAVLLLHSNREEQKQRPPVAIVPDDTRAERASRLFEESLSQSVQLASTRLEFFARVGLAVAAVFRDQSASVETQGLEQRRALFNKALDVALHTVQSSADLMQDSATDVLYQELKTLFGTHSYDDVVESDALRLVFTAMMPQHGASSTKTHKDAHESSPAPLDEISVVSYSPAIAQIECYRIICRTEHIPITIKCPVEMNIVSLALISRQYKGPLVFKIAVWQDW